MNEKIESLAIEKDFAALNAMERSLVLSEMPQEAFEHLRSVLLAARQMDAGIEPSMQLRAQLMAKMAAQPKPSMVQKAIGARISILQAAAILLFGLAVIWLLKPETVRTEIVTNIQVRVDTIWQEKTLWRDRVVWRDRLVYREKPAVEPIAFLPEKKDTQQLEIEFSEPVFAAPRVGTSLGDAPELLNFFTQGDK